MFRKYTLSFLIAFLFILMANAELVHPINGKIIGKPTKEPDVDALPFKTDNNLIHDMKHIQSSDYTFVKKRNVISTPTPTNSAPSDPKPLNGTYIPFALGIALIVFTAALGLVSGIIIFHGISAWSTSRQYRHMDENDKTINI